MNYTQNIKTAQVTEKNLVMGVDIGSETNYARAFNWRGQELPKKVYHFATARKASRAFGSIPFFDADFSLRESEDQVIVYAVGDMPTEDVAWGYTCYKKALEMGIGTLLHLWDKPDMA